MAIRPIESYDDGAARLKRSRRGSVRVGMCTLTRLDESTLLFQGRSYCDGHAHVHSDNTATLHMPLMSGSHIADLQPMQQNQVFNKLGLRQARNAQGDYRLLPHGWRWSYRLGTLPRIYNGMRVDLETHKVKRRVTVEREADPAAEKVWRAKVSKAAKVWRVSAMLEAIREIEDYRYTGSVMDSIEAFILEPTLDPGIVQPIVRRAIGSRNRWYYNQWYYQRDPEARRAAILIGFDHLYSKYRDALRAKHCGLRFVTKFEGDDNA